MNFLLPRELKLSRLEDLFSETIEPYYRKPAVLITVRKISYAMRALLSKKRSGNLVRIDFLMKSNNFFIQIPDEIL